ncbi:hypothetical protein O181_095730 [Austropuccinia psidii MF-1]|uniref:Tet-like 2OG-Fe(II) oxygenase domain-containing protein n=1 Tax=Austropuccinia psidii MF-1 TaxID=1389203 RepID=A0A9Q3J680_9BASI|nr:hypothetical protein [Austropuccinia psidii MF-1]
MEEISRKRGISRSKPRMIYLNATEYRIKHNEMNEEVNSIALFVGNSVQLIAKKALNKSHRKLESIGASSFEEMIHQESIKSHQFETNMTFTFGDFHNNYHMDEDFSNYSYVIWIPVKLEKVNLVKKKNHMGLKEGLLSFQATTVE